MVYFIYFMENLPTLAFVGGAPWVIYMTVKKTKAKAKPPATGCMTQKSIQNADGANIPTIQLLPIAKIPLLHISL